MAMSVIAKVDSSTLTSNIVHGQTDRQTDRQTDGQTNNQTEKSTNVKTSSTEVNVNVITFNYIFLCFWPVSLELTA